MELPKGDFQPSEGCTHFQEAATPSMCIQRERESESESESERESELNQHHVHLKSVNFFSSLLPA